MFDPASSWHCRKREPGSPFKLNPRDRVQAFVLACEAGAPRGGHIAESDGRSGRAPIPRTSAGSARPSAW